MRWNKKLRITIIKLKKVTSLNSGHTSIWRALYIPFMNIIIIITQIKKRFYIRVFIDDLCWEKRSDVAGINPKAIIADPNTFMIWYDTKLGKPTSLKKKIWYLQKVTTKKNRARQLLLYSAWFLGRQSQMPPRLPRQPERIRNKITKIYIT